MCQYSHAFEEEGIKTRDAQTGDSFTLRTVAEDVRGFTADSDPSCGLCIKDGALLQISVPEDLQTVLELKTVETVRFIDRKGQRLVRQGQAQGFWASIEAE